MGTKLSPLLCELHAHTTWSDGDLTIRELVDLYGRRGFDVLAITDHAPRETREIHAGNYDAYLNAVRAEALRGRELYDLLVIPGLELTYDDPDPFEAAHVVALGLREYVDLTAGLESALGSARGPAGRRERRLPPPGAHLDLEDDAAVREVRARRRRVSEVEPPCIPGPARRPRGAARRLALRSASHACGRREANAGTAPDSIPRPHAEIDVLVDLLVLPHRRRSNHTSW